MLFRVIIFFIILGCGQVANAQQNDNSPYSRLGIGDVSDRNLMHTRMMGSIGSSYIDGYHINIVNPASYAFLNATSFDAGIFAKYTRLKDQTNTNDFWSGNIEYLSLAFPLKNPINAAYDGVKKKYKLGMAFTLRSNSHVNYNIESQDSTQDLGLFTRQYIGSGGTYEVVWGNALKYKDISFGVNLSYMFGQISYQRNVLFGTSEYAYNNMFSSDYNVSGFSWNAGVLYFKTLNSKKIEEVKTTPAKRLSVGAHFRSRNQINTYSNLYERLEQALFVNFINVDTITFQNDVKGEVSIPMEYGAGMTYYNGEKLAIGIDYNKTIWSRFSNTATNVQEGTYADGYKFGLGGYYRPNYKSIDNFFERVYYRFGAFYQKDGRQVNGMDIENMGITMGLGMPFIFQRKISHINLGLSAGVRGRNTPISENYVKFMLGVTFNDDEWFLKRKYN